MPCQIEFIYEKYNNVILLTTNTEKIHYDLCNFVYKLFFWWFNFT